DVGSITLCINLQEIKGTLKIKIDNKNADESPLKFYFDGTLTFNELTRIYKTWSRHSKVYKLLTTKDGLVPPSIQTGPLTTTY
ncbi:hypothetical protein CFSAN001079_15760, partial [Salmonella enterica subsp. enterica serovar Ohio str. CFSAN001079]